MQILFFVFAFLLALGFITHSELDRFRDMQASRIAYNRYLKQRDEALFNDLQKRRYDLKRASSGADREAAVRLNPRLNFYPFLSERARSTSGGFNRLQEVMANLVREVYRREPLYEELSRKYGDLEGLLLQEVMTAAANQPEALSFKHTDQLSELVLDNPDMQLLWYRLLKGTQDPLLGSGGYPPLSAFVDVQPKRSLGLSLYLAPRPMLYALFGRSPLVEEITRKRLELYRDIQRGRLSREEASGEFRGLFSGGPEDQGMGIQLDLRVNKAKPPH